MENNDEKKIVEVMALGRSPESVEVEGSETVEEVLEKAGVKSERVMADGNPVDLSESIGNTKLLNAIPKVKGGFSPLFPLEDEKLEKYPYKIKICERAYLKMYYYTQLTKGEVGGLLKVSYDGKNWLIKDAILLPQKATKIHFELNDEDLINFSLNTNKEEMKQWKGWWHSHVNMESYWSEEDISTFNNLNGVMGDLIGVVLNKKRQFRVRVIKNKKEYEGKFIVTPNDFDTSKYKEELRKNLQ